MGQGGCISFRSYRLLWEYLEQRTNNMAERKLPARTEDFSAWYNQLILRAELADYAPVRGCMIVRPYEWALWEQIQHTLSAVQSHRTPECRFSDLDPAAFSRQRADPRCRLLARIGSRHDRRR
jgi:prolyl-tRNA synthetase